MIVTIGFHLCIPLELIAAHRFTLRYIQVLPPLHIRAYNRITEHTIA